MKRDLEAPAGIMECFRIDESGYTGFDLLNVDQRFQGAAAIAIGNDDAARLIREHLPRVQASELTERSQAAVRARRSCVLRLSSWTTCRSAS